MRQIITTTSANEAARTEVLEVKLAFIALKCAILALITTTFGLKFSIYAGNAPFTSNGERPLQPRSRQSVLKQARDRHRSRSAWHRCSCPSHGLNCVIVNIANDSGFGT